MRTRQNLDLSLSSLAVWLPNLSSFFFLELWLANILAILPGQWQLWTAVLPLLGLTSMA